MRATGPGQSAFLLLDVVDVLTEAGIPYAVVGALAVSVHGMPRFTTDADARIWLGETGVTGAELRKRLESLGHAARLSIGEIDDPLTGVLVIEDAHRNEVDLILGVRGMDPGAIGRRITTALLGSAVHVIGGEDLLAMKIFAGGPQDLEDARGILQVSRETLSLPLLRNLTARYGTDASQTLDVLLDDLSKDADADLR